MPVEVEKNENNHYRGLHIVLVNSANGKVEVAQAFDTSASAQGFDNFIANELDEGYYVVAACKDDCVTNLSQAGKKWFASMGSTEIWNLEPKQGFAFIGKSKGTVANERRAAVVDEVYAT